MLRWLLAGLLGAWGICAWAEFIEAEGSAYVFRNNVGEARMEAYQNALRQAAMSVNATVTASDGMAGNQPYSSIQVRSGAKVTKAEIVSETVDGNMITVRVRAQLGHAGAGCGFPSSNYRKKIAAVYFPLLDERQVMVNDFYDYQHGVPAELLQKLSDSDAFLSYDKTDLQLFADPMRAPAITGTSNNGEPLSSHFTAEYGIQYVVAGVVRDLRHEPRPEDGLLSRFGFEWRPKWRNIEIEFFLFDAYTSELMGRHRYAEHVEGDVTPEWPVRFGTREFFTTPVGEAFNKILHQEVAAIQRLVSCKPFTVRLLEVKGDQITIDAGSDTKMQEGDELTVYQSEMAGPVFGAAGKVQQTAKPQSTLTVRAVFPGYTIADLKVGAGRKALQAGDFLKVW